MKLTKLKYLLEQSDKVTIRMTDLDSAGIQQYIDTEVEAQRMTTTVSLYLMKLTVTERPGAVIKVADEDYVEPIALEDAVAEYVEKKSSKVKAKKAKKDDD